MMTIGAFLALFFISTSPVMGFLLSRKRPSLMARSVEHSTQKLYRHQLAHLQRAFDIGLLDKETLSELKRETARRLPQLNDISEPPPTPVAASRTLILLGTLIVVSSGLYLLNGHPSWPPQSRQAVIMQQNPKLARAIAHLRERVTSLSADDPRAFEGYLLLGQVEEKIGAISHAIIDYRVALSHRFSPELAIRIAELKSQILGYVSSDSLELYRKALDASPNNAPWLNALHARIAEGERAQDDMK